MPFFLGLSLFALSRTLIPSLSFSRSYCGRLQSWTFQTTPVACSGSHHVPLLAKVANLVGVCQRWVLDMGLLSVLPPRNLSCFLKMCKPGFCRDSAGIGNPLLASAHSWLKRRCVGTLFCGNCLLWFVLCLSRCWCNHALPPATALTLEKSGRLRHPLMTNPNSPGFNF